MIFYRLIGRQCLQCLLDPTNRTENSTALFRLFLIDHLLLVPRKTPKLINFADLNGAFIYFQRFFFSLKTFQ